MPTITPYTERYSPEGLLNTRADGSAGAQIGAAVQNIGEAGMGIAEAMYRNEVQSDVTNVHVEMARKRVEWQQKLSDMSNNTTPGDNTLAPRVMDGLKADFETLSQSVKTKAGQQTFAKMSADMTSMFGQEAIGIQSRLDGEFAKNQYTSTVKDLGTVAAQDHTQWESLVKQGNDLIDDPNGRFARLPQPTREAFKQSFKENIMYDAARGFARRYPAAVLGSAPPELRSAVQKVASSEPRPGLPPDLKAPVVKAYDQKRIDSNARSVAQPSPYDGAFQEAARLYNLDPRELKMRAVVESGLNPNAVSSQNAGGIMQFTPEMAKQLGVDRTDPKASIFAAAKLIAGYRAKSNGDMSKVDMMYYGGEGGTAWGPNTKQYAANMAAQRQAVGLGSAVPPESFAPSQVTETGQSQDWAKPKTGIQFIDQLPAEKFFAILTEAEQYQRAYDSQGERGRLEKKRAEEAQQESVLNNYTQRIYNPTQENGGRLDEVTIVSDPVLTASQKHGMVTLLNVRAREMMARAEPKSNPAEVNELTRRIHAPEDDPSKIWGVNDLYDSLANHRISSDEFEVLLGRFQRNKDGGTSSFERDVNTIRGNVTRALQANPQISAMEIAQPGTIADVAARFGMDLDKQIDAYRKQGKNPRDLLNYESPDYVLKPGRISSFIPSTATLSAGAAKTGREQLKAGDVIDGHKFKGGDPANKANWEKV